MLKAKNMEPMVTLLNLMNDAIRSQHHEELTIGVGFSKKHMKVRITSLKNNIHSPLQTKCVYGTTNYFSKLRSELKQTETNVVIDSHSVFVKISLIHVQIGIYSTDLYPNDLTEKPVFNSYYTNSDALLLQKIIHIEGEKHPLKGSKFYNARANLCYLLADLGFDTIGDQRVNIIDLPLNLNKIHELICSKNNSNSEKIEKIASYHSSPLPVGKMDYGLF